MSGLDSQLLVTIALYAVPGVFAITMHEVAHGWAAKQLGDPTAYMLGRLSLNPLKHADPIGTIAVPIGMLYFTGIAFGWAKPVPVAFKNLRHPKRDMILVAAAGPGANFAMASFWTLVAAIIVFVIESAEGPFGWLLDASQFGITINVILMIFNLIPIPPLDGGRVLSGLLPAKGSNFLDRVEPFGFIILLLLMLPPIGVLFDLVEPFIGFFLSEVFYPIAGFR